ncbi:MAG: protein kinase [Ignavibacteriales bacterium]|jgi:serine/threonine protein kinase|nr:protein kinase [Ignavibacteriales bacterium]MCC6637385.1 protein kinase [Ignavibacteriaceae bacterium]
MVGAIVGSYKIISKLGEGGMGVVYKALDLKLERFVALKILNAQTSQSAQFIERFKREARNQAKLNHPNIIPVYGFIDEQGYLGIAMEYVDGETLEQIIDRKGSLELGETLDILQQILRGVGYAHQKGFIHRDIKPSNVMMDSDGVAKIMDFGISKSIYEKGITKTGTKIGTLLYMSPEQINAEEPTRQSDIYSIGITFYEMLSGITPYESGTEFEIMQGHLKKPAPKLAATIPGLPPMVDKIIAKALEKDQAKRFGSCDDFLQEIGYALNIIRQGPSPTKDRSPMEEQHKEKVKKSVKFTIFAILAFIGFVGIVYLFYTLIAGFKDTLKTKEQTVMDTSFSSTSNPYYQGANVFERLNTGVDINLRSVAFNGSGAAIVVGDSGKILISTDNGSSWKTIISPEPIEWYATAAGGQNGFLIGGANGALQSVAPGDSVFRKLVTPAMSDILNIEVLSNGKIIALGANGDMLISDDKGITWKKSVTGVVNNLYSVDFMDGNSGVAVGDNGTIIRTDDGGNTWILGASVTNTYLKDIKFIGSGVYILVGGDGQIFRSPDGGREWKRIDVNISAPLVAVRFSTPSNGVILSSKGDLFRSEDAGESWKYQPAVAGNLINSVTSGKTRLYMAASGGAILFMNF